jgi:hypothetical protein
LLSPSRIEAAESTSDLCHLSFMLTGLSIREAIHGGELALLGRLGLPPLTLPLTFLEVGHAPLSIEGTHSLGLERQLFDDLTEVLAGIQEAEDGGGELAGVSLTPRALACRVGCRKCVHLTKSK